MSGLGTRSAVTLPYTAPSDGLVLVQLSSTTSGGYAYLQLSVGGYGVRGVKSVLPANGSSISNMTFMKKGEELKELYKSNIDSYTAYFTPLG